jgi:cystathionine beta-lyase
VGVAFATPAYPPFSAELPQSGVQLEYVRLVAEGGVDLAALERALAGGVQVFVLVNPHNPTGHVYQREVKRHGFDAVSF